MNLTNNYCHILVCEGYVFEILLVNYSMRIIRLVIPKETRSQKLENSSTGILEKGLYDCCVIGFENVPVAVDLCFFGPVYQGFT